MTTEERIDFERRLTQVEDRAKSNTRRIDEHDEAIKENNELIGAIKEIVVETKYMRKDLNETIDRLDELENKDGDKWEKFKWTVLTAVISIVVGFLACAVGLK